MRTISILHKIRKLLRNRNSAWHPRNESYKWIILANVMIGTFMAVLDATVVNVGLPKIMASFGIGIDKAEWIITIYMLAMAVALPISGWLADKFGYKRMYFIGLSLFTMGSLLCGISTNENMLILSRVIQGFGAGVIQPVGAAIVMREFPKKQLGMALGFWGIASAASLSFGPLIGGYLIDTFSWPFIFGVNIPLGIIGLAATFIIQHEYRNKRIRKFDIIGFISIIIFLPVTLYALSEGTAVTNSAGWSAPYILVCFAIAIIALAVFITTELTVSEPLIDLSLLGNRNFGMCSIISLVFGIGNFGSMFLLPIYLQTSLGYTAVQAGAVFLPVGIVQGIMSPFSGKLADKMNPKIPLAIGIILFALSLYLNYSLTYLTETPFIMISLYLRGFSMGLLFAPLQSLSFSQIPREKMAQASGISNTLRQVGASFGIALLATLLTTRATYHTQMYSRAIEPQAQAYVNTTNRINNQVVQYAGYSYSNASKQGQSEIVNNVKKQAYIQGIDDDFFLAALVSILGAIPVIFLIYKKKDKVQKL